MHQPNTAIMAGLMRIVQRLKSVPLILPLGQFVAAPGISFSLHVQTEIYVVVMGNAVLIAAAGQAQKTKCILLRLLLWMTLSRTADTQMDPRLTGSNANVILSLRHVWSMSSAIALPAQAVHVWIKEFATT